VPSIAPARLLAYDVLKRVLTGGHADAFLRQARLDARDAALAEELVLGCLRYQAQLDFIAEAHARGKLDAEVRIALRLGIYQLRYLDRIPPHAAVGESVELVKRAGKRSAAPLVNAVLRKVGRQKMPWPNEATALSCPQWLLDRWRESFGNPAPIALAFLEKPEVFHRGDRIMDIGSQSIVPLLELQPGHSFLDLCAAPGNKTAQALETALGLCVACDRSFKRLATVPGHRVHLDAADPLPFGPVFDRILVDAPCSGTGTLGRNPEIKWRLQPDDLARQHDRQVQILHNALGALKPGGRLVYSTCSLEPEENEHVLAALNLTPVHTMRRLPGRDPGDGFFAAVMEP
jgi:16S rRNA (cytosine967-C5)-methyltransferase